MLSEREEKYFKELTQLIAPSGCENNVAYYLKNEFQNLGLEIVTDNIGSIFGVKKSKNPNAKKVMIVAHMDEVGFYIARILPNGLSKCTPIGSHNLLSLQGHRVIALNNEGNEVRGIIDSTPNMNQNSSIKDYLFDFGFKSIEDYKKAGLNLGSPLVVEGNFEYSFDKESIISKAIDDRCGIVLELELLNELKDVDLPFDLYVGGSVQQEVGSRGASTCSSLINPDFAIVLDCLMAKDNLCKTGYGDLGGGVLIQYLDKSMIGFKELLDLQIDACKKTGAKYQYFESTESTDAGIIHKNLNGILTLTHCICARGIHTSSSMMRIDDYLDAKKSLIYLVSNLTNDKIEELKERGL